LPVQGRKNEPALSRGAYSRGIRAFGADLDIPSRPALAGLRSSRLDLSRSRLPPGALEPEKTPQFLVLGFDDNTDSGSVDEMVDALSKVRCHDGSAARASFYFIGSSALGSESWKRAIDAGHECGNHTFSHPHGIVQGFEGRRSTMGWEGWQAEIQKANVALERLGIPRREIVGFRQPYLEHSANSLYAAFREGFAYDCSIEEGFDAESDGSNFVWPYTLDAGLSEDSGVKLKGFLEIPVYALMVPRLADALAYGLVDDAGVPYDLYEKLKEKDPSLSSPKITGFDYNLWNLYGLTGREFSAILTFNLDLRIAGNRCPMTFGAHTEEYGSSPALAYRREALLDFVNYAASKDCVRIVSARTLAAWLENPAALSSGGL